MEKILIAVLESGLPVSVIILLIAVGFIGYLLLVRSKSSEAYVHEAISAMQITINEQHADIEKLSQIVYKFKQELEKEKQRNYTLQDEISQLKEENRKLKSLVTELENLVSKLKKENETLRGDKNEL